MMSARDLLAAVCDAPDDDAPRLRYAAAITEGEQSEFIRLQVSRTADERRARMLRGAPTARESELLRRHGPTWAHYLDRYVREDPRDPSHPGWGFERGFVAFARLEPENFVALGDRLFELAPIQHVDLIAPEEPVRSLFAAPQLARLESLSMVELGLDDDDAEAMADCAALRRCVWIDLRGNRIGYRGVRALAASPYFRDKARVILTNNPADPGRQPVHDWGPVADFRDSPVALDIEHDLGMRVPWFHARISEPADRYHARAELPIHVT